jgi:hypothetical protein
MLELDLHGLTVDEALRHFVAHCTRYPQEPVRIIHGYGSTEKGARIRKAIRAFLLTSAGRLEWKAGEDVEANPGVTIVYPGGISDAHTDWSAAALLEFCSVPRTESKIARELRNLKPREVKQLIRTLVRSGKLLESSRSSATTYVRKSP